MHRTPPAEFTVIDAKPGDVSNLATRFVKFLSQRSSGAAAPAGAAGAAGTVTIGRANDNDIVIPDVLASREHATLTLTPLGTEIRDRSINGTFVNGIRVGSAILTEGDVVTIGNVDLLFNNSTLAPPQGGGDAHRRPGGARRQLHRRRWQAKQTAPGRHLADRAARHADRHHRRSGAGKTTLARLIAGYARPTSGSVTFEGHDIHAEYASLRSRIGMVPQDDVVHRQLTVNQALGYAAELRLPPDTTKADRAQVVAQVLEELEMTKHPETRVDKLSGGQRKRASVALELLTGPSLLILDEPTSGLDPALDHQVMTMLRQLADAGRVVIVVTHCCPTWTSATRCCWWPPAERPRSAGRPTTSATRWAPRTGPRSSRRSARIPTKPTGASGPRTRRRASPRFGRAEPAELGKPVHTNVRRQISTIARRQVRLVVADRGYFLFLALLPFILGSLSLTVPGSSGFHIPAEHAGTPDESAQVLSLLLPAAAFMGIALTIRDLVGERPIFRREQAVGLSSSAYLLAKTAVFCGFAIVQAAVVTAIVVVGKGAPTRGAVVMGHGTVAGDRRIVYHGRGDLRSLGRSGPGDLGGRPLDRAGDAVVRGGGDGAAGAVRRDGAGDWPAGLDQLSFAMPTRWGYAAAASTVDVRTLVPGSMLPQDRFWEHTPKIWLFDMGMLAALVAALRMLCAVEDRLKL